MAVFGGVSVGEGGEEAERRAEGVNENLRRVIGFASKGKADNAVRHEDEVMLECVDLGCQAAVAAGVLAAYRNWFLGESEVERINKQKSREVGKRKRRSTATTSSPSHSSFHLGNPPY